MKSWNLGTHVITSDTADLRLRIIALTYESCFNDADTLHALVREGSTIAPRALQRIRKSMGIYIRVSVFNKAEADAEAERLVRQELDSVVIDGFGRQLFYHFRTQGNIISRPV